jgi:hypothetical protein
VVLPIQLLHPSQKILESRNDKIVIELSVINIDEHFRKLISKTGSLKMIEPGSLKN